MKAAGNAVVPDRVVIKCINTVGRVRSAAAVEIERESTIGGVGATECVAIECIKADGRVSDANVVQERIFTQDGVLVRQAAFLASRSGLLRKRKAGEREQRERWIRDR